MRAFSEVLQDDTTIHNHFFSDLVYITTILYTILRVCKFTDEVWRIGLAVLDWYWRLPSGHHDLYQFLLDILHLFNSKHYSLQISFISVVLFSVFIVHASVVLKSAVGSSRIQTQCCRAQDRLKYVDIDVSASRLTTRALCTTSILHSLEKFLFALLRDDFIEPPCDHGSPNRSYVVVWNPNRLHPPLPQEAWRPSYQEQSGQWLRIKAVRQSYYTSQFCEKRLVGMRAKDIAKQNNVRW